jgi:phosphohistidine phosphatase SixA
LLANGPVAVRGLQAAAHAHGHTWSTIRRAQKSLEIVAQKTGVHEGWEWRLPDVPSGNRGSTCSPEAQGAQDAHKDVMSTLAKNEHLGAMEWEAEL